MNQRAAEIEAELRRVTDERDLLSAERAVLLAQADRLREEVVALHARLAVAEGDVRPQMRGLASLIPPPGRRASG